MELNISTQSDAVELEEINFSRRAVGVLLFPLLAAAENSLLMIDLLLQWGNGAFLLLAMAICDCPNI
jgi:hypothetical protein